MEDYTNYKKISEDAAVNSKTEVKKEKQKSPTRPKEDKKPERVEPYFVTLVVRKLNVRKGPSKDSPVISVLSIGKPVKIVAEKDGIWGKIEDSGWINLEFVEKK